MKITRSDLEDHDTEAEFLSYKILQFAVVILFLDESTKFLYRKNSG